MSPLEGRLFGEGIAENTALEKPKNLSGFGGRLLRPPKEDQARAIRRCGELLEQIKPANGANQGIRDGSGPNVVTRKAAAEQAGLSERQRKTAS